jgi:hypothetical protein
MSTRAQVRFATREEGVSFNEHPEKIHAQFYVHYDGYPEGLGCNLAESIVAPDTVQGWEIEHVQDIHTDLSYIYYVWSDYDKDTWISIFKISASWDNHHYLEKEECIFVGTPEKLIEKYKVSEYSCINFKKDCDCFSGPTNIDEGDYEACVGYEYKLNTNDDG